jgi:hypothetical protein
VANAKRAAAEATPVDLVSRDICISFQRGLVPDRHPSFELYGVMVT